MDFASPILQPCRYAQDSGQCATTATCRSPSQCSQFPLLATSAIFLSQDKEAEPEAEDAAASAEKAKPQSQMRIVSYFGHWLCDCGRENALWDRCVCGQVSSDLLTIPQSYIEVKTD